MVGMRPPAGRIDRTLLGADLVACRDVLARRRASVGSAVLPPPCSVGPMCGGPQRLPRSFRFANEKLAGRRVRARTPSRRFRRREPASGASRSPQAPRATAAMATPTPSVWSDRPTTTSNVSPQQGNPSQVAVEGRCRIRGRARKDDEVRRTGRRGRCVTAASISAHRRHSGRDDHRLSRGCHVFG